MESVAVPLVLEPFLDPGNHRGSAFLGAQERKRLALRALEGTEPISHLANAHGVSRKVIYQQAETAIAALDEAFCRKPANTVLFEIPVTRPWIEQIVLSQILHPVCIALERQRDDLLAFIDLHGTPFQSSISNRHSC